MFFLLKHQPRKRKREHYLKFDHMLPQQLVKFFQKNGFLMNLNALLLRFLKL